MATAERLMGIGVSPFQSECTAIGGIGPLVISASGSSVTDATQIKVHQRLVSIQTAAAGTGVKLPTIETDGDESALVGDQYIINNNASNTITVYTSDGALISADGVNASSVSVGVNTSTIFYSISPSQWAAVRGNTTSATLGAISVTDYGAVSGGNATANRIAIQAAVDAAFGTAASPHGQTNSTLNRALYFPHGIYDIDQPIIFTAVHGAYIFGDGRFTTKIRNQAAGGSVFVTNGFQYSRIELIDFEAGTNGVCVDLDYDGSGLGGVALQSNTLADCFFNGGDYGVRIGFTGFMGSENLFLNNFFNAHTAAGLYCGNFNALQQTVIGGNFQSCNYAINTNLGSVNVIMGVGFQVNSAYDIYSPSATSNTINIIGCRSESVNFAEIHCRGTVTGCHQTSASNGDFVSISGGAGAAVTISGCLSNKGCIRPTGAAIVSIHDSCFDRDDFLQQSNFWNFSQNSQEGSLILENIRYGATNKSIRLQRIGPDNSASANPVYRTETSAAALTDSNIAGFSFNVGDTIWQSVPVAGGSPGWVCTTAGVAGVGAVFKAMANLAP